MTNSAFEPVIGLEVHAELLTQSKMFCGCAVVDSTIAEPNTSVCEICTGMPGTLPVINERAIEFAVRVALALHCTISETSVFARKNYFYPDLPKGYQISQFELPLAHDGWLAIETEAGEKRIRIRRVHLEEDTGKLFHRQGRSLVDFNRSGIPLLEIVSEPDLSSIEEAKIYTTALRSILRYLEVTTGDMEKGVIRFEANVSVRQAGSTELGIRTEIKNLNSFRAMTHALAYEVERQSTILKEGGKISQETLGWDETSSVTVSQRSKEEAHDYRYFPEPDLPPLHVEPTWVAQIQSGLPELPLEKSRRFVTEYGLTAYAAGVLTTERSIGDYFEAAVESAPKVPPIKIANWLSSDLFGLLNQAGIEFQDNAVPPADLARLVEMVETGEVNATSAKTVLAEIVSSGNPPDDIVRTLGLSMIQDPEVIESIVRRVLDAYPRQVADYLDGNTGVFQWLFGQVMKEAEGRANPSAVRSALSAALE
ncbi:MAG: Asp-tRNA(Asn)/Glu-tRNA(Gln) amidotransferase subunit GatB [Anaerolineales bacterium]|nr:Asp-tRNA(Asn)/Glu-tRNA(Gln) amidotransferase subunit GatB [Anaerolineales bacterium]